ncbi:MAG: ABC transporter ATP-binding protein [Chloroflexia bacterium]
MHERTSYPASEISAASPNTDKPVVSLDHVTKRFGNIVALRNVSLQIHRGEVYGLLGPNGAGKSTLLKLLLGFLYPDKGTIKLFGSSNLTRAHARLGYLPEKPRYHGNFSGREYLRFHGQLSGFSAADAARTADHALQNVGLKDAANRRIKTYSKGMTQRLGLAVVLCGAGGEPPDLIVLDEPASGLDPEGQIAVRDFIRGCKERGSTVLLCSHQLTDVEKICSTVGILRGGRLVVQTDLKGGSRAIITGTPREGAAEIAPALIAYLTKLHPTVMVRGGEVGGEPLSVNLPIGPEIPHSAAIKSAAIKAMIDGRWDITSLYIDSRDLESLYLRAVQSPTQSAAQRNGAKETISTSAKSLVEPPQQVTPTRTGTPTSPLPALDE